MESRREAGAFIRILNSQWPQMFGELLEESGYNDQQKKFMAIMSLYHSPEEDLEEVDAKCALSDFSPIALIFCRLKNLRWKPLFMDLSCLGYALLKLIMANPMQSYGAQYMPITCMN